MAEHGLYLLVQALHPAVCNLEFPMRYNPIEVCLYQTVTQRDGIDMSHPIHADMLNEVVNDLFLFPLCNPEKVPGRHIYDMGRILMPVMQLELIYSEKAVVMRRLYELSVLDVEGFKPALVDCLYCMLVQTAKLSHLLVGICAERKQVTGVSLQLFCDTVML